MRKSYRQRCLTVVALLAASLGVQAATHTWDAGGTNASWGTAANWDNNTLPTWGNQADLIFNMDVGSVDTLFLGADRQFRSILFGSNLTGGTDSVFDIRNFSAISGGAVNMLFNGGTGNSSITVQNSSLARVRLGQNNSGPTAFQTDTDLHHNSAATVLQFDGATTGAGKLNVYGVGRTTFTRNNSFGGLNLYGGSVVAWNSATALGTNSVTLGQTGSSTNVSLFFGSNVTNANAITVSSGSGTRTIGNTDGITQLPGFSVITGNAVLSGTIDLSAGKDLTFDVNAYAATTTDRLTVSGAISGTGGINKTGAGILQLNGTNTYAGNTTVSVGELLLSDNAGLTFVIGASNVNNKVTGAGKGTFNGDFYFNLSTAGTTVGDSWTVEDLAGTVAYGTSFSVNGFTDAGSNKWTKTIAGSKYYEFSESTGILTVIPEPATIGMLGLGAIITMLIRRMQI